ncbi:speckle-type POZ protein B [Anabrus simplex]|uniref:speckle-type POZ protein B n=1 Tax=Anabrus simplex TaxID=316456 RepID=UPI0034DDC9CB
MAGNSSGTELMVPTVSDVIYRYTWNIRKYARNTHKRDSFDSPPFEFNINGILTKWNMGIRFWKGPEGKKLPNPVVLCLNLLSCGISEPEQIKIRFQFAIYNEEIKQWEMCHVSRTVLQLQTTQDMLSIGYRDLSILERHIEPRKGDVSLFVKLQLVQTEAERNSLYQDLGRLLNSQAGDIIICCDDGQEFQAHTDILRCRSPVLAYMISLKDENNRLDLHDMSGDMVQEILRYIYTDHVDNLDTLASSLLAAADRLKLPGLKVLCERSLLETITPESVASLLLLADQFNCEPLKKAALAYCEDNATSIKKTLAWKVMEIVNPDLFMEACEAGLGSSISSNLDSLPSDTDLNSLS